MDTASAPPVESQDASRRLALLLESTGEGIFGIDAAVFDGVNFALAEGEFVCLIAHSGCGKTTS